MRELFLAVENIVQSAIVLFNPELDIHAGLYELGRNAEVISRPSDTPLENIPLELRILGLIDNSPPAFPEFLGNSVMG